MRIADICTRHVVHIQAGASIREAAQQMRNHHVGTLVVTEQPNGERVPVGILTDRDIAIGVVAAGVDPESLSVDDVMSRDVITCAESEELFDVIQVMRERGVRRLPVLNAAGGVTGMVSADDAYGAISAHLNALSHALARGQVREMRSRG